MLAKRSLVVCVSLVFSAMLVVPSGLLASEEKTVDWMKEIVERLDMEYAEEIVDTVCAMGDSSLGFRGAGGPSDIEAAEYIAEEMDNMGLLDVALEGVPVDAWEFRGAYLEVDGMERMEAASFGGSPGTDGPLERDIVWVGNGYDSDYDGKSVENKIVLINWIGYDFWVDSIAFAALEHGVAGIVVTTIDCNVGQGDYALSCHDGLYSPGWPPMISISKENATLILEEMGAGEELTATMCGDIVLTPKNLENPEEGGLGYNVIGFLPGKDYGKKSDEFVIFGPHHDAWFQGGMDDTSGIAAMLVIAKAMSEVMEECNVKPDRTIIFTSHTAEEYGILDTYYDWCWGAYYQVTQEHPDWVGRTVAYLCMELMGMAGEPVYVNCVPELHSFVKDAFASNREHLPYGAAVDPNVHCWADHWTFAAAGIPALEFETVSDDWETYYYHTQCDAPSIIDYGYMRDLFVVIADMTVEFATCDVLPYNYQNLAVDLNSHLNGENLWGVAGLADIYKEYGFDPGDNLDRLLEEAAELEANTAALHEWMASLAPKDAKDVNEKLRSISAVLGQNLIGMGVWEQDW
jgi:Iap family predicted aminopeptidase